MLAAGSLNTLTDADGSPSWCPEELHLALALWHKDLLFRKPNSVDLSAGLAVHSRIKSVQS